MESSAKRNTPEQQGDVNPPAKKTKVEEQPADGRLCASCNQVKSQDLFSSSQKGKGAIGKCKPCVAGGLGPFVIILIINNSRHYILSNGCVAAE
jgi:hypothetical protein